MKKKEEKERSRRNKEKKQMNKKKLSEICCSFFSLVVTLFSGNFLLKFGSKGENDGEFQRPRDIVTDKYGNIYVADSENHRIQIFDSKG